MTCESGSDFDLGCAIGMRIRHHRWMLGVPRDELAHGAGLDLDHLIAVESDQAPISGQTLSRIALVLGVSVNALAGDADGFNLAPTAAALRLPAESVIRRKSTNLPDEAATR